MTQEQKNVALSVLNTALEAGKLRAGRYSPVNGCCCMIGHLGCWPDYTEFELAEEYDLPETMLMVMEDIFENSESDCAVRMLQAVKTGHDYSGFWVKYIARLLDAVDRNGDNPYGDNPCGEIPLEHTAYARFFDGDFHEVLIRHYGLSINNILDIFLSTLRDV